MIRIMQNKILEKFAIGSWAMVFWVILILNSIVCLFIAGFIEIKWYIHLSMLLITISSIFALFCTCGLKDKYKNTKSKTEEKLDDISQQIADIRSTTSNNSEMYFLQNLAASIGDKGSLWTDKQIERFLQCMEFISKNEKLNSNVEAEEQTFHNGN